MCVGVCVCGESVCVWCECVSVCVRGVCVCVCVCVGGERGVCVW